MRFHALIYSASVLMVLTVAAGTRSFDASLADFPRQAGELDDTARVQRAIDATGGGESLVKKENDGR